MLQQCLPFTVLKRYFVVAYPSQSNTVATVLTVYGIETVQFLLRKFLRQSLVATAPTVYGMRRRVRDSRGAERR